MAQDKRPKHIKQLPQVSRNLIDDHGSPASAVAHCQHMIAQDPDNLEATRKWERRIECIRGIELGSEQKKWHPAD